MNDYIYQIVKGLSSGKDDKLRKPYKVIRIPVDFRNRFKGEFFLSLRSLRRNSLIWKQYHKLDPKSAEKITKKEFIETIKEIIITPSNIEFDEVSYKILKHSLSGELKKNMTGVHLVSDLLQNEDYKIVKTQKADLNGVWKANIEYYSKLRNKKFEKLNSTMFPESWSVDKFMFEINFAFLNKKIDLEDNEKFNSITESGVPVVFVIKNNKLKTVYPRYIL
jgi:hypothetical protein